MVLLIPMAAEEAGEISMWDRFADIVISNDHKL